MDVPVGLARHDDGVEEGIWGSAGNWIGCCESKLVHGGSGEDGGRDDLRRRCSCLRSRAEVARSKCCWDIVLMETGTSSLGPARTRRMSVMVPGAWVKA
jgi:hypothetical protein